MASGYLMKGPRKIRRRVPSLISLSAYCVHPRYREDYRTLRVSSPEIFEKKYPNISWIKAPNPFAVSDSTWVRIARTGGNISPLAMTVMGRMIGAFEDSENGKTLIDGPDDSVQVLSACLEHPATIPLDVLVTVPSIQEIPAWNKLQVENPLPQSGYRKVSLANLSQDRWLRLEVDLYVPRPMLEKQFRSRVEEYQKLLNLEGRNKKEMLKYLALYHVTNLAREQGKRPQVILHPVTFKKGKKSAPNAKKWEALKKDFFRARVQAKRIFEMLEIP